MLYSCINGMAVISRRAGLLAPEPCCSLDSFSSNFFPSPVFTFFVNSLYIFDSNQIGLQYLVSFLFNFLKNTTTFASSLVLMMHPSVVHLRIWVI